jgi:hypothetical protein
MAVTQRYDVDPLNPGKERKPTEAVHTVAMVIATSVNPEAWHASVNDWPGRNERWLTGSFHLVVLLDAIFSAGRSTLGVWALLKARDQLLWAKGCATQIQGLRVACEK